ncbi:nucleotidyltransferase domain-containing protein [Paenibacillus albus]|uniref:Polymerase nucleotidyl transferase domain-containing protein n=1 Tax=Paenibacillus albus TaxID=2495582 RepID=A0A3Q8X6V4_9BACL|nr:nucleotidyltransferase domain-containing protein [Paenibacillus albus]AZN41042.1 hypothetical protein EJC50_16230 [Paenibacillus albus]
MNEKSAELREQAIVYMNELAEHPVLKQHWNQVTLILKGSAARGNSDQYSDIDYVFFCDESLRQTIIEQYFEAGLIKRNDGIFLPIDNWAGHYHFESFEMLQGYFEESDYPQIWEFQQAIPLHDPEERFVTIMAEGSADFLRDPIPAIKDRYLDLMLTLDWLRHPLIRGDNISAAIHSATLLQQLCRIAYLLDGTSYPHDKWVSHYLYTTRFGELHKEKLNDYLDTLPKSSGLTQHLALEEYPAYANGAALMGEVIGFIREQYGDYAWIDEWYLYV